MATTAELSENSHQGFEGIKAALCLASMEAKSNTASGMRACLRRNGIGSRSSGKERDETGLDYFLARYYFSAEGRFMIPDWSAKPQPIPYAEYKDPQSLNLYAYVRNNPLSRTDPNGHFCVMGIGTTCTHKPPPPPKAPSPPPFAMLITNIKENTTKFVSNDPRTGVAITQIETRVVVDSRAEKKNPGAGGPFTTPAIKGLSSRGLSHGGDKAYGPVEAFIDVGDPRARDIHGGGSGLKDPMAPRQGWHPTMGCTRGQNEDVIHLGNEISEFQRYFPDALPIPYRRE